MSERTDFERQKARAQRMVDGADTPRRFRAALEAIRALEADTFSDCLNETFAVRVRETYPDDKYYRDQIAPFI